MSIKEDKEIERRLLNGKIMRIFNLNWLWNNKLSGERYYCPECSSRVINLDDVTSLPICKCGWSGDVHLLFNKDEIQTKERLKLIDKILKNKFK